MKHRLYDSRKNFIEEIARNNNFLYLRPIYFVYVNADTSKIKGFVGYNSFSTNEGICYTTITFNSHFPYTLEIIQISFFSLKQLSYLLDKFNSLAKQGEFKEGRIVINDEIGSMLYKNIPEKTLEGAINLLRSIPLLKNVRSTGNIIKWDI